MIKSFKDQSTENLFHYGDQANVAGMSGTDMTKAAIRLDLVNDAERPEDLNLAPNHSLVDLGDGNWELHLPLGYKISFRWHDGNAYDVHITKL